MLKDQNFACGGGTRHFVEKYFISHICLGLSYRPPPPCYRWSGEYQGYISPFVPKRLFKNVDQHSFQLYSFWRYPNQMIFLLTPEFSESRHFIERQEIRRTLRALGHELKGHVNILLYMNWTLSLLTYVRSLCSSQYCVLCAYIINLMNLKKCNILEMMITYHVGSHSPTWCSTRYNVYMQWKCGHCG